MENKKILPVARFCVETLFLLCVLLFSMVMLIKGTEDRPVYFTLISGICGKITRLKIKDLKQPTDGLDEIDGRRIRP